MYRIVNNQAPLYLQELLPTPVGHNLQYQLRNSAEIRVPFARLENFKKSFIVAMIQAWNQLEDTIKSCPTIESFKRMVSPKCEPNKEILYYGSRWASIHHSRIRIGCSKLNDHLCNFLHVIPSPECHCGYGIEDPTHFFFSCPSYAEPRLKMLNTITQVTPNPVTLDILLYGDDSLNLCDNKLIFDSVHLFLKETRRFE